MAITTRLDLIDYCKRKLGAPVINLELDDDQVEDRIDDAIEFYQDIHYDGTEKIFVKHKVIGTSIVVASTVGFIKGETVNGANGNFDIFEIKDGTTLIAKKISGTIAVSETITGTQSGIGSTVTSVTLGDADKGYVTLPDNIIGLSRVLPFKNSYNNNNYLEYSFDPRYQIRANELYNISSSSLVYYSMVRQHLSMMDYELRPLESLSFNRRTSQVYLTNDWDPVDPGEFLVFDAFQIVDPESFGKMYNDRLFKEYATAMIKLQWGNNLKKFEGVQMIGGITINGQQIYDEAANEIQQLEEKIRAGFELPPIGYLG